MHESQQRKVLQEVYQHAKYCAILTDKQLLVLWANQAATDCYPVLKLSGGLLTLIPTAMSGELISTDQAYAFYFPALESYFSATPTAEGFLITLSRTRDHVPFSMSSMSRLFLSTFSATVREPISRLFIEASAVNQMGEVLENQRLHDISKEINRDTYLLYRAYSSISSYFKLIGTTEMTASTVVDLANFIDRLCKSLSVITLSANIPVLCNIRDQAVVSVDIERLLEAIMHVLANSCKYTKEGNVIKISLTATSTMALLSISDSGLGIPAHLTQQVFEPFFSYSHDDYHQGLGLGLTLARLIVTNLGGTLALSSTPGDGTTVAISLPLEKNPPLGQLELPDSIANMYRNRFSPLHIYLCESCGVPSP